MSDANDNGGARLYPNSGGPTPGANPIAKFLPIIIGAVVLLSILALVNFLRNRSATDDDSNRTPAVGGSREAPGGAMGSSGGGAGAPGPGAGDSRMNGAGTPTGAGGATAGATSGMGNPPGPAGARGGGQ